MRLPIFFKPFLITVWALVMLIPRGELRAEDEGVKLSLLAARQAEVRRLSGEGRHLDALTLYRQIEGQNLEQAVKIAVAESAWALGLVAMAREAWLELESDPLLVGADLARILLSHAVAEFQEEDYEESVLLATRATNTLGRSALRARGWHIIGDARHKQGRKSDAIAFYERAIKEGEPDTAKQCTYNLALVHRELGENDAARDFLLKLSPLDGLAEETLELLLNIDLERKDYQSAAEWLKQGKKKFAKRFEDDLHIYLSVITDIGRKDFDNARLGLSRLESQYSPENQYYLLGKALIEERELASYGK